MIGLRIGIDLGTATVIAYVEGKGIVFSEPSVVVCDTYNRKPLAMGEAAMQMLGRTPKSLTAVHPMKDGIVSDFELTEQMLRYYLQKICGNVVFKPNVIVCLPSSVTNLEKRTVLDVITAAGAGHACLIEEPLAAAFGAGIGFSETSGSMVVDIGGGTTDTAVITMGSIAVSNSVKSAGNSLTQAIIKYLSRERDITIGELTAEEIKSAVGGAILRDEEIALIIKGKSIMSGMPVNFEASSTEIYWSMRDTLDLIINGTKKVLETTPPELLSDIMDNGIVLSGGGALLYAMDKFFQRQTGVSTRVVYDPVNCVARGIGVALKDMRILEENGYIFKTRDDIEVS